MSQAQTRRPGIVVHGGSLTLAADVARRAERAGFDSVWTTEFYDRSATVSLAAMAAATSRITVGSAIMYAVGRSPLVLAVEAGDLDELSGGRLILGLGVGTKRMQHDWHGADPSAPAPRVEELVPLLRRLWAMGPEGVHHDGRFFHVGLTPTVQLRARTRPDLPVYLAAVNVRMLTAVGRVADGLVGHPLFTRRYVEEVARPALSAAAEQAGRPVPGIAGYLICAIHADAATARREAKAQIAFYCLVRTYDVVMALHGFQEQAAQARAAWQRGDRDGMIEAVTDEMLEVIGVAGTPEEVRQRVAEQFSDLYERPLLYSPSFGLDPARLQENLDAILETFAQS